MPEPIRTNHTTRATTAPMSIRVQRALAGQLLVPGDVVASPETKIEFRVDRLIGEGGFGQAFLARRMGRARFMPPIVCVKVSARIDGWVREAYFGQLLDGHPRAIRVYDSFPIVRADGRMLYCLVLEYAAEGDLRKWLNRRGKGWPERTVRREIAGILEVLGKLHRGQMLHRDLTPMNVFVCADPRLRGRSILKLGDFGIVRHQSDRRGIDARTMNVLTAPSDILDGAAPKWQARDDVYQVGQLLGMLIKGDASSRIRTSQIRSLSCSDHLKEIVYRCLAERRKRYESAEELIDALCNPRASLRAGVKRTLKDVHLAFTGILSRRRSEAVRAAKRAGAIVHGSPSAKTTVVVRGRPNPLQAAGPDGGVKLLEIKRLREKGHRITVLNDAQFWRLAGNGAGKKPRRRSR